MDPCGLPFSLFPCPVCWDIPLGIEEWGFGGIWELLSFFMESQRGLLLCLQSEVLGEGTQEQVQRGCLSELCDNSSYSWMSPTWHVFGQWFPKCAAVESPGAVL